MAESVGHFSRGPYLMAWILYGGAWFLFYRWTIVTDQYSDIVLYGFIIYIITSCIFVICTMARLRDAGYSAGLSIYGFIPIIAQIIFLPLLFTKTTRNTQFSDKFNKLQRKSQTSESNQEPFSNICYQGKTKIFNDEIDDIQEIETENNMTIEEFQILKEELTKEINELKQRIMLLEKPNNNRSFSNSLQLTYERQVPNSNRMTYSLERELESKIEIIEETFYYTNININSLNVATKHNDDIYMFIEVSLRGWIEDELGESFKIRGNIYDVDNRLISTDDTYISHYERGLKTIELSFYDVLKRYEIGKIKIYMERDR